MKEEEKEEQMEPPYYKKKIKQQEKDILLLLVNQDILPEFIVEGDYLLTKKYPMTLLYTFVL